jgi:TPR repeat protein
VEEKDLMFKMANQYWKGDGVEEDESKAFIYYMKAALMNHPEAQRMVGIMYSLGRGVQQDLKQAVVWFEKGTNLGDQHCQYNLGLAFLFGKGVEINIEKSIIYLTMAAQQGHTDAQMNLFALCKDKEPDKAMYWIREAARNGDREAISILKENGYFL